MGTSKAPRILVISPAGEIYNHDDVRWYPHFSQRENIDRYFNIGDMVVFDSTLKILSFSEAKSLTISKIDEKEIDHIKSYGYDYCIVRASNFIHNEMNWLNAIDVLKQIHLPVYAVGVGAQAHGRGVYKLEGMNLRFWKLVSERSRVIGVRGAFTADVLAASGIHNVEIVGCPSMFRTRRRELGLTAPQDPERVAFSIRRESDGAYSSDVKKYRAVQRDFMLKCVGAFDTRITIHGEPEEKAFFYGDEAGMDRARALFRQEGWWTPETEARMEACYRDRLFFFLKVADYDAFIRTQDFAIGYRVHGVLPALANGIPGVLVRYDSRSTELAYTHGIPSIELSAAEDIDVLALVRNTDFSQFNKVHTLRYDKFRFVLEQNGMAHRLDAAAPGQM
ncbi:polysaccharide pyruvyl transferase family protein [Roseomonas fluvialis]|uniref:Polysaccharide pyruvyl transferase domain-containing protein n=1 Tax=Roseomonas fluvialis TaxID=1750527 RepID=A0ABN6NZ22_9PROT|nr:polysaccharide pyruvyl transferase family protein [Roseomonas fluvialis]BDG71557.1 hypothetical protein Rmf_14860 [Roseomonas fluvialis]